MDYNILVWRNGKMNLYRIISLESFVDILHNERERYVRPSIWDDNFEGYLLKRIYDPADRRKIIEDMYNNICLRNYESTIGNIILLEHGKWFVYGQCWSILEDSDALWRIYAYGNHAIQIKTTDEQIDEILRSKSSAIKFDKKEVVYDVEPNDDLLHKQVMQLKQTKKIYEPFFHKRKAFEHEKEFRVLINDESLKTVTGLSRWGANWKIKERMQELPNDIDRINEIENRLIQHMGHWREHPPKNDYYLELNNIKSYILGIRVHPLAEKWYVNLIKGLCEEYEIPFNGQSNLYGKEEL